MKYRCSPCLHRCPPFNCFSLTISKNSGGHPRQRRTKCFDSSCVPFAKTLHHHHANRQDNSGCTLRSHNNYFCLYCTATKDTQGFIDPTLGLSLIFEGRECGRSRVWEGWAVVTSSCPRRHLRHVLMGMHGKKRRWSRTLFFCSIVVSRLQLFRVHPSKDTGGIHTNKSVCSVSSFAEASK